MLPRFIIPLAPRAGNCIKVVVVVVVVVEEIGLVVDSVVVIVEEEIGFVVDSVVVIVEEEIGFDSVVVVVEEIGLVGATVVVEPKVAVKPLTPAPAPLVLISREVDSSTVFLLLLKYKRKGPILAILANRAANPDCIFIVVGATVVVVDKLIVEGVVVVEE